MHALEKRLAKLEVKASLGQANQPPFAYLEDWLAWKRMLYQSGRLIEVDGVCMATQEGDSEAQEEADIENRVALEVSQWEEEILRDYDPTITPLD